MDMENVMPGTLEVSPSETAERVRKNKKILDYFSNIDPEIKEFLTSQNLYPSLDVMHKSIGIFERVGELSKIFRQVKRDDANTKKIMYKGRDIEVPLVFQTKLPATQTITISISRPNQQTTFNPPLRISTRVPHPPDAALVALNEHQGKFDHMEVWWIPKKLDITEIVKKPDPMIVGVVLDGKEKHCFEIYRWVDESVESSYWAREGY